jgi:hypothetical protein
MEAEHILFLLDLDLVVSVIFSKFSDVMHFRMLCSEIACLHSEVQKHLVDGAEVDKIGFETSEHLNEM